ncbi:MAG TPA: type VI secretion system contractile sheath large subunit [Pyrinomonadaceae bacterium]|nr:type VI secretion system contractile sheath large subunit [Pyrinomonadaceae bacterium]
MNPDERNLETEVTLGSEKGGVIDEPIFQLLILGNWAGEGSRHSLDRRRPIEIDRDNFDDVIKGLGVRLHLNIGESRIDLTFNSIDDFHPDEIYRNVPLFAELRDLRKRLRNADTFNSAAREVREWSESDRLEGNEKGEDPAAEPGSFVPDNLLDSILSKPEGGGAAPKPAVSDDLSRLVGKIVRPHLVSVDEDEQTEMLRAVDEATSSLMRALLHDRSFRELESAWRGLFFMVRRTDTSSDLRLFILDVLKDELSEDLRSDDGSQVVGRIASGRNEDPFAAVFGNFAFEPTVDDVAALIRLAQASARLKTPFVSHLKPDVFGIQTFVDHTDPEAWDLSGESSEGKLWNAMTEISETRYLGLAMPRFLVRLPFGAETEPLETFSFEEFTETFSHEDYLWANPVFAVAQMLAQTYTECGWDFGNRFVQDMDGLPLHVYKRDGETIYLPCSEVQLSQNAADVLAEQGIMPLVSFKNADQIRLVRFRSVCRSEPSLAGRWR